MALVDFRRAFDRTWRTGLLWKMADLGLPRCLLTWVRAFLQDRQACVRINGQLGGYRCVGEGTPQGAVLSPLLFLLFINDISRDFPPGVEVTLFADDLALFATEKNIAGAEGEGAGGAGRAAEVGRPVENGSQCGKDHRHSLHAGSPRGAARGRPVPRHNQTSPRADSHLPGGYV